MAIKIDEQYVKQVNSIMSKLPQNPFIVDVGGKAIEISYKNRDISKDYSVVLELADKVAEYTTANSSTTSYKYALIAAILLAGVPSEEYEVIDTASGTVKDYVEAFTSFAFADGYKKTWLELNNLIKKDSDLLYLALLVMVNENVDRLSSMGRIMTCFVIVQELCKICTQQEEKENGCS